MVRAGTTKTAPAITAGRVLVFALAVVVVAWLTVYVRTALSGWFGTHLGWDLIHYVEGAERWLAVGSPYEPRFIERPYVFDDMAFVHPPIALPLFAAFTVLPDILWWLVPLGTIAWFVAAQRPSWVGWAAILLILALPLTPEKILGGNSVMWVTAFVALGLRFGWPWALLVIKPTLVFVGLIGIRDRRAWLCAAVVGAACVPFGALWLDWLATLRNFAGPSWYSLLDLPFVLLPVIAWLSRGGRPRGSTWSLIARRTSGGPAPSR